MRIAVYSVAAFAAIALPALLLWTARGPIPPALPSGVTLTPARLSASDAPTRRLFLDPLDPARAPEAEDAPRLIGIVGRLPDKAIAMIRAADGSTRTLAPGESHDGWTLTSLSPDAALFTRGTRRVRSFLPAEEPAMPEEDASH